MGVGERLTLADISVACTLLHLYQLALDPTLRSAYVNVNRWFLTIVNQPNVKAVLGEVKLCSKPAEIDPKKYTEYQTALKATGNTDGQQAQLKDSKKDKKKETKKEQPKKEEKKPAEPEELDETELALAAE